MKVDWYAVAGWYLKLMVMDMGALSDDSVFNSLLTCPNEASNQLILNPAPVDIFMILDYDMLKLHWCYYGWQVCPTFGGMLNTNRSLSFKYCKAYQPVPVGLYSRSNSGMEYNIEVWNVAMNCRGQDDSAYPPLYTHQYTGRQ